MLFATLDPTMRGVDLPGGRTVILSDTVGFISDLPTQLVAAFRATLEEVLGADLILHVRDIAHDETQEQAEDVLAILEDLGVDEDVPLIEVWNKIDKLDDQTRAAYLTQADRTDEVVAMSAWTGEGVDALYPAIDAALSVETREEDLLIPFSEGRKRASLHETGVVLDEVQTEDGWEITVRWTDKQANQFHKSHA
jgi:GTP-binding protein HflX